VTRSVPTPEAAPTGGETVYAITKMDQERLTLAWGRQTGIPTVALRYSCTYGPRQSIFATRILNGQAPILYEDGEQTRDMCFVEDIARANLLAATSDKLDGLPVNVGSGRATTVREMARLVGEALGQPIEPLARGEFRPGEIRHLTSDITRARTAGYQPQVQLAEGIRRYVAWISAQGDVRDYFGAAEAGLREKRIVHRVAATV
jgi:dTDP-L-rhamnose 4-epimerase